MEHHTPSKAQGVKGKPLTATPYNALRVVRRKGID